MYKKFSNRLSGGVANSRHRAPFRHLDAVELHRVGGENRASGVQSEKSRESYGESFLIFFFIPKILRISYIYANLELNNWKLYESRIKFLDLIPLRIDPCIVFNFNRKREKEKSEEIND